MLKRSISLSLLVMAISACEPASPSRLKEEWNAANDPLKMMALASGLETDYRNLPKDGRPERMPWSDDYWATYQGGVAYRWNWTKSDELTAAEKRSSDKTYRGQLDEDPALQKLRSEVYGYRPYTKDELLAMKEEERAALIRTLSPAEKYDIYRGRFDYPTVASERDRTGILKTLRDQPSYVKGKKIPTWFGICHAWAPATIMFDEPKAVTMSSKDQIQVDFGASDVKALLSHMIDVDRSQTRFNTFMGVRCNTDISDDNIKRLRKDVFGLLEARNNETVEKAIAALNADSTVDAAVRAGLYAYILAYADQATFAQERYKQLIAKLSITPVMREDFGRAQERAVAILARAGGDPLTPAELLEGIRLSVRTKACSDTNAGAFHLVLANLVGLQKQSFGVDVTRDFEVWNQAVAGYDSIEGRTYTGDQMSPDVAPGTVKEVEIRTTFYYTGEMAPNWDPFRSGSEDNELKDYHEPLKYHYKLELDADHNVIGGSWLSNDRPDFLWGSANLIFSPEFADLKRIYYTAIQPR